MDAFFKTEDLSTAGATFRGTPLTRGPWDPGFQHAGPPTALLGRAIERVDPTTEFRVARITFEIMRPVPVDDILSVATTHHPGRRVDRVGARLVDAQGRVLIEALALRVRRSDTASAVAAARSRADRLPSPGPLSSPAAFFPSPVGYHTAIDTAFVEGSWDTLGPATAWLRPRVSLVDDEPLSPLSRVLITADSGNGLSAALDTQSWRFLNADLSVSLAREPRHEWVGLVARTAIGPDGGGLATSELHDLDGPIGVGTQTLLVEAAS